MRTAAGRIFATANRERSRLCCLCFLLFKNPRLMFPLAETVVNVTSLELGGWIACAAFVVVIVRNVIGIKADSARMKQGTSEVPVHLAHPVEFQKKKEYADKLSTEHGIASIQERQGHLELSIVNQLSAIKLEGAAREARITENIAAKIDEVMKDVFHRVNENDKAIAAILQQQKAHNDEILAWRT